MFSRSPYNHLPAGFRLYNTPKPRFRPFVFSPNHSPHNSPFRDPDAPPSTPLPHVFVPAHHTPTPNVHKKTPAPAKKPSLSPATVHPRRKHPHKRLSCQHTHTRLHLRKRPRFRTHAQLKRQHAVAAIHDVEGAAENTMRYGKMDPEDRIFIKQLEELRLDQFRKNQLGDARERFKRAQELAPQRKLQHAERDRQAALLVEEAERTEELRRAEQLRLQELERFRREEEMRRREQERLRREEETRRRAEEQARRREQSEREYHARKAAFRKAQEDAERRAKEQAEQRARQEAQRQDDLRRTAAAQADVFACLQLYDAKWEELKTSKTLTSVMLHEMPWPVFQQGCTSPDDISQRAMEEFIFHPLRRGMESKSRKDRVRAEMLKFHPDKFDSQTVVKLRECDRERAIEIAGTVARILNTMMAQEIQRERAK